MKTAMNRLLGFWEGCFLSRLFGEDSLDRDPGDTVLAGERRDGLLARGTDLDHLRIGDESVGVSISKQVASAPLSHLVGHVVVVGSEKEMAFSVHTEPHVALMENLLAVGNWPMQKDPCNTVGGFNSLSEFEAPILLTFQAAASTTPEPASTGTALVNLAPKKQGRIFSLGLVVNVVAVARAVVRLSAYAIRQATGKLRATVQAVFDNLRSSHDDLLEGCLVRIAGRGSRLAAIRSLLPLTAAAGLLFGANFASAESLWQASTTAGERQSTLCDLTLVGCVQGSISSGLIPVERIADDYGRDLAWVVGSHAADLYSTAWALRHGAREANPLGPDVESRLALKMASCASTGLTLWKLRRDGHGKTATVLRWLYVVGNGALVVNNIHQGSKKK
jgi:hypothetical protein